MKSCLKKCHYDNCPKISHSDINRKGVISFIDFWKQQYEEWKKEQQSNCACQCSCNNATETNYRFKTGDVTPKQNYSTYQKYIQDNACQYSKQIYSPMDDYDRWLKSKLI